MRNSILALVALVVAPALAFSGESPLSIRVVLDQAEFVPGEPVVAWVVYQNSSNSPIKIATNLEHSPLVLTLPDGLERPYIDGLSDYALSAPTCRVLPAKGAWVDVVVVDTSRLLKKFGDFSVRAVLPGRRCTTFAHEGDPEAAQAPLSIEGKSSPLAFRLVERADPGVSMILACAANGQTWSSCLENRAEALVGLSESTGLRPYAELSRLTMRTPRLTSGKELIAWSREFRKRNPDFRQLGFLYFTLAETLDTKTDPAGWREIESEAERVLSSHAVRSLLAERRPPAPSQ